VYQQKLGVRRDSRSRFAASIATEEAPLKHDALLFSAIALRFAFVLLWQFSDLEHGLKKMEETPENPYIRS
jgi:hypothetical protein